MTGALYLAAIAISLLGIRGLVLRLGLAVQRQVIVPVTVIATSLFLLVDTLGISRGWFSTPISATVLMLPGRGPLGAGLPVEEPVLLSALAILVVVLMSARIAERRASAPPLSLARLLASIGVALFVALALVAARVGGEYTAAMLGLASGAAVAAAPLVAVSRETRRTLLIFLGLTVLFDNLMCAVGLFGYEATTRSGIALGLAPIEDLLYAAAFALVAARLSASASASGGRWWRLVLATRPISWINTGLPFAGGALAAGAGEALGTWFVPLLLWWSLGYNAFLYGINDLFDVDTDRRNPRKGGAEGALLHDRDLPHLRLLLFLSAAAVVPIALSQRIDVVAMCIVGLVAATVYSAPWLVRARAVPILDSVVSATHFVIPAVAGLLLGGRFDASWIGPLGAFFLWNVGSHVVGALQDIDADRRSGIATVGTLLGIQGGGWFAAGLYAAAAVLLLVQGAPLQRLGAALPAASVVSLLPLLIQRPSQAAARSAWRRFMLLNLFLGAGAAMLIIQGLVDAAAY